MLKGEVVTVRPVQEEDLPALYEHILDIDNRGDFYPRHVFSLSELRKELSETGFWTKERGMLVLIDNRDGKLVGQIAFFPTVPYMDEMEIGYILYDQSARRKGAMTEALELLTWYLFNTRRLNRIRLTIVTENAPPAVSRKRPATSTKARCAAASSTTAATTTWSYMPYCAPTPPAASPRATKPPDQVLSP